MKKLLTFVALALTLAAHAEPLATGTREPGYRGIWFTLGQKSDHGDKYSGGLGTYTAKHRPLAVYSPEANKTFFVYGGSKNGERHLLAMIGYYDHATGLVPRPVVVHDKDGVNDPHDNPSLAIDPAGHLWVFVSGRGQKRPGFIYRGTKPHDIANFERVLEDEFTYPQPLHTGGEFFLFHTKYTDGRELYWRSSGDGREWSEAQKLAGMGGHYQVSAMLEGEDTPMLATAFNYHPGGKVDLRTNLYYVHTPDLGKTWTTAAGEALSVPLTSIDSPALVHDYAAENRLVYVKDLLFDADNHPVILYVTSAHHAPGPEGDPRTWHTARWTGDGWEIRDLTTSTHNYDMGQLWIEKDIWRVIAPTETGPQRLGAGGEIVLWESADKGHTWKRVRQLTHDSPLNHGYVRRPLDAHPNFYAFWADGNPDGHSASHLYFTNRDGTKVHRLPYTMAGEEEPPHTVE